MTRFQALHTAARLKTDLNAFNFYELISLLLFCNTVKKCRNLLVINEVKG